jgi:hypothetical protein
VGDQGHCLREGNVATHEGIEGERKGTPPQAARGDGMGGVVVEVGGVGEEIAVIIYTYT